MSWLPRRPLQVPGANLRRRHVVFGTGQGGGEMAPKVSIFFVFSKLDDPRGRPGTSPNPGATSSDEKFRVFFASLGEEWRSYLGGFARDPLPTAKAEMAYSSGRSEL